MWADDKMTATAARIIISMSGRGRACILTISLDTSDDVIDRLAFAQTIARNYNGNLQPRVVRQRFNGSHDDYR